MKVRKLKNGRVEFYCPGCKDTHIIRIEGTEHPVWGFNGDYNKPTFTPSILERRGHYVDGKTDNCWCRWAESHPGEKPHFTCGICHSFVTDGKIQFLNDCTHELAGQTVELPELEEEREKP